MSSWNEAYTHPDWLEDTFERDMRTTERWDRDDDERAREVEERERLARGEAA